MNTKINDKTKQGGELLVYNQNKIPSKHLKNVQKTLLESLKVKNNFVVG